MSDERIDFSALDPRQDARFERMTANITERARFELARRAASRRTSLVELVGGWARPALLAAASIAVVSLSLLASVEPGESELVGAYMPAGEVPATAAAWYEENREPTADELLFASMAGENQ